MTRTYTLSTLNLDYLKDDLIFDKIEEITIEKTYHSENKITDKADIFVFTPIWLRKNIPALLATRLVAACEREDLVSEFIGIFSIERFEQFIRDIKEEYNELEGDMDVVVEVIYRFWDKDIYIVHSRKNVWKILSGKNIFELTTSPVDEEDSSKGYFALLETPTFSIEESYDEIGKKVTYITPRYLYNYPSIGNEYFCKLFYEEGQRGIEGWGYIKKFLVEEVIPNIPEEACFSDEEVQSFLEIVDKLF